MVLKHLRRSSLMVLAALTPTGLVSPAVAQMEAATATIEIIRERYDPETVVLSQKALFGFSRFFESGSVTVSLLYEHPKEPDEEWPRDHSASWLESLVSSGAVDRICTGDLDTCLAPGVLVLVLSAPVEQEGLMYVYAHFRGSELSTSSGPVNGISVFAFKTDGSQLHLQQEDEYGAVTGQ